MKTQSLQEAALNAALDPYHAARLAVVEQINRDRAAHSLAPVELEPFASQVEDRHCQEMAAHHYLSHWNLKGLLPYHRYHFAGGRDHAQENLSRATIISTNPAPIPTDPEGLLPYLLDAHQRYMDEQPPDDGHRRNVLDPGHTHVGIGLAVVGGEFTMSELFINRYVRLAPLPAIAPAAGTLRVEGEVLAPDYGPFYAAVFCEEPPQPRTIEELNRTYAYEDMGGSICDRIPPWKMNFDASRRRFRFNLSLRHGGPAWFHFVMWVRKPIRGIPYLLSAGANQVDTKDGVACAGWVFRQS